MRKQVRSVSKRIGLFGNFGTGNFGNEASLEAMIRFLRQTQPDMELTCICFNPERVRNDHDIPALPIHLPGHPVLRRLANRIHAFRTMRNFDVMIIPGTGILCDFCATPLSMPYVLFKWCLAARLWGTRIAFVSVGAGPVDNSISRWFIKRVASMAQYRSYRNMFSREFVKSLGLNAMNDPIYPDIAFRLRPPLFTVQGSAGTKRGTVCIGVMQYHGWHGHLRTDNSIYEEYVRKLTEFVLWLLSHDYRVRLIMGDESDRIAVDDLRRAVLAKEPSIKETVLIVERAHSGEEVMRQISDADVVVSSRFHNLVFALLLGKLTISTGYAEYHKELLAQMGLGAFCQHSEHIDIESIIAQFTELMSNRSHYEAIIRNAVNAARENLAHQDCVFTSKFLEPGFQERGDAVRSRQKMPLSL